MVTRVALIGLDGMHFSLIDRIFKENTMPFLKGKYSESIRGVLKSTIPPYTPSAWTNISTGVTPRKHGIYGFMLRSGAGIRFANSGDVKYPRIWEILSIARTHSVVINVPLTYPVDRMYLTKYNILISAWDAPKKVTYPPNLFSNFFQENYVYAPEWWSNRFRNPKIYVRVLANAIKKRKKFIEKLIKKDNWQFFYIMFNEPDWLMHKFPLIPTPDGITIAKDIFMEIDSIIKMLSEKSDLVILCSDHGFKEYNAILNLNALLRALGFVKDDVKSAIIERILKKVITRKISRLRIFDNLRTIAMQILIRKNFMSMKKTIAFAPENYIIFAREEYIHEIKTQISKIVKTYEPSDLYGSKNPTDPDLIVFDERYSIHGSYSVFATDEIISKHKIFDHSLDGIFIAFGDINKNGGFKTYSQFDITPTILSFLGLPIPHDTDGKVIEYITNNNEKKANYTKKWRVLRRIKIAKKRYY